MATTPSQIAEALITTIEAIVPSSKASRYDVFRGQVGGELPANAGDRFFVVGVYGSNRFEALCQTHYETEIDLTIFYRGTDKPAIHKRIADDQHEITKAILTAGSFHGASNPAILNVELSDPTPPAEVGEGLMASARTVTVRFDDSMNVGV